MAPAIRLVVVAIFVATFVVISVPMFLVVVTILVVVGQHRSSSGEHNNKCYRSSCVSSIKQLHGPTIILRDDVTSMGRAVSTHRRLVFFA